VAGPTRWPHSFRSAAARASHDRRLDPVQTAVGDDGLAGNEGAVVAGEETDSTGDGGAAPGAQYTVGDLAEATGVGVRQLQKLFRDEFDMSPAHYLRNVRLDRARSDLISNDRTASVSDVASRWGFNHLGRFAQHYEQKFGETPSKALKRR
jgi:AraC-like DNA-binding protein